MVPLITAVILGLAPQAAQSIKTDFLPSHDLPDFKNRKGEGQAVIGMCNGIDELTTAYLEVRRRNPNAFPLRDIAETIRKYHGEDYLKKTMETATYMAYKKGNPEVNFPADSKSFVADVVAKLQESHQPLSIGLVGANGSHRVTVYGADQTPTGWVLHIADNNHAEAGIADNVTLALDAKTGALTSTANGQTIDNWSQGGAVQTPVESDKYIDMINMAILGKPVDEIRSTMRVDKVPLDLPKDSIYLQKDPKAGGVLIRFDPTLFTRSMDEAMLADLNRRAEAFLKSENGGAVIINLRTTLRRVALVPFDSLSPAGELGGLTRVLGFVTKADGHTFLAGLKEPGRAPIPGEWLAVALQSQYAQGLSPYISLDPNPETYSGPQRVRIGDIPANLRSSSYIKTMLDADYLMKKINLGKEEPKASGFVSWVNRMETAGRGGAVRMWFTPYAAPAGDSYIYRSGAAVAVLFESQVALLSERQKMASEAGYAAGPEDAVAAEAAQDFSEHLNELTAQYPDFERLRGVFDVSKLAVCWRALKVKPNGLEPWLKFVPLKTAIPDSYPGIGPDQTKDGKYTVSGGAIAKARFKPAASIETDRLEPMLAGNDQAEVEIVLPATLTPSASAQVAFQAQNLLAVAEDDLRQGSLDDALSRVGQVLLLDPQDEDALTLQAIVLGFQNRYAEAIAITNRLIPDNPTLLGVRAVFKAGAGDFPGALGDAHDAETRYPDSESILAACVAARILALDADGAAASLLKLRAVSPAHPALGSMDAQIDLIRYLGPAKARERMALLAQIPVPVSLALMQSPATPGGMDSLKGALEQIQSGVFKVPERLYIPERIRLAMACATITTPPTPEELVGIEKGADQIIADHPDWPSGYLAKCSVLITRDAPVAEIKGALKRYAELEPRSDPVLTEFQLVTRIPRLAPFIAALGSIDPSVRPELRHEMAQLAAEFSAGLAGQPFLTSLAANPRFDAAELALAIRRGTIFESDADVNVMLPRITESVGSIPPSDPAFLPALVFCAESLEVLKPTSLKYDTIAARALKLSLAGAPSRYILPLAASYRSKIWSHVAFDSVRQLLANDSPAVKAMGPAVAKIDRLLKPESAKDPIPSVATDLAELAKGLGGYVHNLRSSVSGSLALLRSQYGDQLADAAELCAAEMQAQMHTEDRGEMKRLATLHPGIEKSPSYAAVAALMKSVSSGVMLSEPEDTIWQRVLRGIRSRYDGLTIQALLNDLTMDKKTERLTRYLTQCKVKTDLGTSLESK